ncbi:MAG TPA: AAA family ATPase [Gammaproteobacteria bacterium]|nr:AAA family ATPase [Gammaproteobacteria bacterium]
MSAMQEHHRLVANLVRWMSAQKACNRIELIETHISSVILAGSYAYKIKKPLDLGFLDFSTLERRRFCCEEEIRLNRRLAEDLYIDVVDITGTVDRPSLTGQGTVIEHAVRMRRFAEGTLLSEHPQRLTAALADELAQQLADFHASVAGATLPPYGTPEQVLLPMQQNFEQIRSLDPECSEQLSRLQTWTLTEFGRLKRRLAERREQGHIRECHGDLHLGNIVLEGNRLILFDGIEFNPELRWIDTMSELAFLLMDIEEKGLARIARQILNKYLEISGDYQGMDLLRFYQLYRAMVRAKVSAIRLHQPDLSVAEKEPLRAVLSTYLENALKYTVSGRPSLLITHGLSGSGKSTVSEALLKFMAVVRVRSDVERKRLAGLDPGSDSGSSPMSGIYTPDFSRKTYDYLLSLTHSLLGAGYTVVVDAAFLKRDQRCRFEEIARRLCLPYLILDFQVPMNELRRRVTARERRGSDPSEANVEVLNRQAESKESLTEQERQSAVRVNQESGDIGDLVKLLQIRLDGYAGL